MVADGGGEAAPAGVGEFVEVEWGEGRSVTRRGSRKRIDRQPVNNYGRLVKPMAINSTDVVVIRGICEKDIDLLLLEEFVASAEFRKWFLERVGVRPNANLRRAERSVPTDSGESDIELTFLEGRKIVRVLVENKIYAVLQPRQSARYRERAETYCSDGICERVVSVVVAPEEYFPPDAKHGFDFFVPYESVLAWFKSSGKLGARRAYKVAAMQQAIERGGRGYEPVPDEAVTRFWKCYWDVAQKVAPILRLPKPGVKPSASGFVEFRPLALGSNVSLVHKLPLGRVDLQFSGMAGRLRAIEKKWAQHMSGAMYVEKAGKSAAIRIDVSKIDTRLPFDSANKTVGTALKAAMSLLKMYSNVRR
jgi:hypothetical protein